MSPVTLDYVKSKIKEEMYHHFEGTTTTVCLLKLENDYTVTGVSACIIDADYNQELGRKYAFEDAIKKIFDVEAYLFRENNK